MTDSTTSTTAASTTTAANTAWHNGVDAGVISAWQNKGYDLADPKGVATKMWEQYAHLESHLGVPADRLIRLPKDAGDAAAWKGVHERLGVPKEAKDYDFAGIKFAGADLEQSFVDSMRGALHKANVSKEVAGELVKGVIKYFEDADAAEAANHTAKLNEQKAKLARDWGTNAEMNRLTAMQAVKRLGIDPATVEALESVVGYDKVMEMFRKIGAGTSEDTFVGDGGANPTTQANAQARLNELQKDEAWGRRLMAGDAATVREFHSLTEQIAGYVAA